MGELEGTACAMKSSHNILLLLVLAFSRGQPRSARQDGGDEKAEPAEANLLNEENLEVDAEATAGDNADNEESDPNKGTPEPESESLPETEPEPEPEGSAENLDEKIEESDDINQQTNPPKKCQKCFRSAFRARHSEFCDGCGGETSISSDADVKPLEKDADRLRRKCRRCSNSKFAEKHQNCCTSRCKDLQQFLPSEPTPTPEPEHRPITSEDLKITKKKKKKDRKKGQKKANKKKDVKLPEDEESISQLSAPLKKPTEEVELGPLGNLIKYLIHQNTFT